MPLVPCPPCIRRLPLMMLDAVPVVMLETLMAEADVSVACFPFRAVATLPMPVMVTLAADSESTFNAELVVSVACFPERVVLRSTPSR